MGELRKKKGRKQQKWLKLAKKGITVSVVKIGIKGLIVTIISQQRQRKGDRKSLKVAKIGGKK